MANVVVQRNLVSGPRIYEIHLYLEADGAQGDIISMPLAKRSEIGGPPGGKLSVDEVWSSLSGFDVLLSYGNLNPQSIWVFTPYSRHFDFKPFAGLKDFDGPDDQSTLLLTTSGFTSAGDRGSMVIRIKKG